jgi:flavin-binding protein dodecin
MTNGSTRDRPALPQIFSFAIAAISLGVAFYQSYLNTKVVDTFERDAARRAYIQTCKEIIEVYFQVKLKVGLILVDAARAQAANGSAHANMMVDVEASNTVARFGALGTFLANFQNEDIRYRYTMLTWELAKIVKTARQTPPAAAENLVERASGTADNLFEKADELFAGMNDDCVKLARAAPL